MQEVTTTDAAAAAAPVLKTRRRMTLKQLSVDKQQRQKQLKDANAVRAHT